MKAGPAGSTWTWQITTGTKKAGNRRHYSKGGYSMRKDAETALTEHASVSITWNIYAHVIPGQDGDAAAAIGDAIYGATGADDAQP